MKVLDGSLRLRSRGAASGYVGGGQALPTRTVSSTPAI